MNFKFNRGFWRGTFIVVTKGGYLVKPAISKEQAEYIQEQGRGRIILQWNNYEEKYLWYRG